MSPATLAVPAATTNALVASPITRPLALTSSSRISPPLSPESVAVHGSRSSLAPTVDSSKGSGLISTSWDTSPFREQENHRKSSATSMISVVSQSSGSNSSSPPLPILSLLVRMRDEMDLVIASERKRRDRGEYTRYAARYSDDPELLRMQTISYFCAKLIVTEAYYIGYFEALVNGGFDRAINAEERKTHKIAEKSKGKEHQT